MNIERFAQWCDACASRLAKWIHVIRWVVLILFLIPVRAPHKHLWMYNVDAIFIFATGYYWAHLGKRSI